MTDFFKKIFNKQRSNTGRESEPICPYCKKILEQRPQRKKKCPFCKNFIYTRRLPPNYEIVLVTEDEAKKIDLEKEKFFFRQRWLDTLKQYGITERIFNIRKDELSQRNQKEANDRDVFWSLFNEINQEAMKTGDFQTLKTIYYSMAMFLNEEGKECFDLLQQSAKMELLVIKRRGVIKKVQIITAGHNSCSNCRKSENKIFSIDEALEKMPIPCKECTTTLYDENKGFCRCRYIPSMI
ncbi:hypothetical protein ISS37_10600 [candidate division KSB1 bacterium]|nr:hypothetical protein [candidate division KSB1 bacterium]